MDTLRQPPPTRPRRLWLAVAAASRCPLPGVAQSLPASARDTLVKAAFRHKFASFVEGRAGAFARPDSPLRVGMIGHDLPGRDLSQLAHDRDRDGRPVTVTRLGVASPSAGVHILYVKAGSATVPDALLTVADSQGVHPRDSVLSFFLEEGRVRLGVALQTAARQRLRLHPRLVAAARQLGPAKPDTALA